MEKIDYFSTRDLLLRLKVLECRSSNLEDDDIKKAQIEDQCWSLRKQKRDLIDKGVMDLFESTGYSPPGIRIPFQDLSLYRKCVWESLSRLEDKRHLVL